MPKANSKPHVVIVDDDRLTLASLTQVLAFDDEYELAAFESPRAALEHIRTTSVDVVLSDFLMPDMSGLDFLKEVKRLIPDVPRILLTGYADKENAIKAINEVGLFQYLEKPWDNEHLKLVIRNALDDKSLRQVLHEKIRQIDDILLERDRLLQSREQVQQGLQLAYQLQQHFLPKRLPEYEGFQISAYYSPALEVGGDFYDCVELAPGRFGIFLADITGHGIQAALMTTLLKFLFSEYTAEATEPSEILVRMNRMLYEILPPSLFVAAMVVVLDLHEKSCHVVNSGLPYPAVLRRCTGKVERLMANGLVLGVTGDELFTTGHEVKYDLQQDDCLFFCTDGLTEAEDREERQFEHEALCQVILQHRDLSAAEIGEKLIAAATDFRKGSSRRDDVLLLSIGIARSENRES